MKDNYKVNVSLKSITCGAADFEFNEDKSYVKCNTCNREYLGGYDELVVFNSAQINEAIENTKQQIGEELKTEITKSLKDAFRGNKFIKFK